MRKFFVFALMAGFFAGTAMPAMAESVWRSYVPQAAENSPSDLVVYDGQRMIGDAEVLERGKEYFVASRKELENDSGEEITPELLKKLHVPTFELREEVSGGVLDLQVYLATKEVNWVRNTSRQAVLFDYFLCKVEDRPQWDRWFIQSPKGGEWKTTNDGREVGYMALMFSIRANNDPTPEPTSDNTDDTGGGGCNAGGLGVVALALVALRRRVH